MTTLPQNLWPEDIRADLASPAAILRAQVSHLSRLTNDILAAAHATSRSESVNEDEIVVTHEFDLLAPALDGYRHRILTARHALIFVYPVRILSFARPTDGRLDVDKDGWRLASTELEFVAAVRAILRSREVQSVVDSLLARSNELRERDS